MNELISGWTPSQSLGPGAVPFVIRKFSQQIPQHREHRLEVLQRGPDISMRVRTRSGPLVGF
jgi:hypothetical protein